MKSFLKKTLYPIVFSLLVMAIIILPVGFKNESHATVTDLTGTVWTLNSTVSFGNLFGSPTYSGSSRDLSYFYNFNVNYSVGSSSYTFLRFGYYWFEDSDASVQSLAFLFPVSSAYSSSFSSSTFYLNSSTLISTGSPTYSFSGGSDVTNSTLISWLQSNATQVLQSTPLDTPVVTAQGTYLGATLSWTSVSNATSYYLGYNSSSASSYSYTNLGNVTSVSITNPGYYVVMAYSSDEDSYERSISEDIHLATSTYSVPVLGNNNGSVYFTYGSSSNLAIVYPTFKVQYASSSTSSWSDLSYSRQDTSSNLFNITNGSVTGYYRVMAYDDDTSTAPCSIIVPGSWTNSYYFNGVIVSQLNQPTNLSFNGAVLSWSAPSNLGSDSCTYTIYRNGEILTTGVTTTSYTVTSAGTYTVRAIGTGSLSQSDLSDSIVYSAQQLGAPVLTPYVYTNVTPNLYAIRFNPVANASSYQVYYKGENDSTFSLLSTSVTTVGSQLEISSASSGTYYVIAVGSGLYSSSEASNQITITQTTSDVSDPATSVAQLILNAIAAISTLVTSMGSFVAVFGSIFAFLPAEIKSLFMAFMIAGIGINMFKWFV